MSGGSGMVIVFSGGAFDSFDDRTEVSTWGTSSDGHVWTDVFHPTTWGVSSGAGRATLTAGSDLLQRVIGIGTDPWSGSFTMLTRFTYGTSPASGQRLRFLVTLRSSGGLRANLDLDLQGTSGASVLSLSGVGSVSIDDPPAAGTVINVQWELHPGGVDQARTWWTSAPAWQLVGTDAGGPVADRFDLEVLPLSNLGDYDFDIAVLDISFGGGAPVIISAN